MFGKLMKYEIKDYARTMLPLYLGLVVIAAMAGILFQQNSDVLLILSLSVMVIIVWGTCLTWFFISVLRFRNNLFAEEAYHTLSLPVTISTHVIVKLFAALFWGCMTFLMSALAVFVMFAMASSLDFAGIFKDVNAFLENVYKNNYLIFARDALIVCLTALLYIGELLARIYASIAIGHQFGEHPMLMSIVCYLGFNMIESVLSIAIGVFEALIIYIMKALETSLANLWIVALIYLVEILIFMVITIFVMKFYPTVD